MMKRSIPGCLLKHTILLMIMACLVTMTGPVSAHAADHIYLPLVKKQYRKIPSDGDTKFSLWTSDSFSRNKYGLVTKDVDKGDGNKVVHTYKYTFKNGLLKKVLQKTDGKISGSTVYKYNKKNKVVSEINYNAQDKVTDKTLYVYKNDKLKKVKHYQKNKLANTWTYIWKGKKVKRYKEVYYNGVKGDTVTYTYQNGKVKSVIRESSVNREDLRYNKKGYPTKWTSKYKENGSVMGNTHTYKYNSHGCITVRTDTEIDATIYYKTKYTTFKKYEIPEGDPIVIDKYMYGDSYDQPVLGQDCDYICGY